MFYDEEYEHLWLCFIDYLDFKDEEIYLKFRKLKKNKQIWSLQVKALYLWVEVGGELLSCKGNEETCLYELFYGEEIREAGWVILLWFLNSLSSNKEERKRNTEQCIFYHLIWPGQWGSLVGRCRGERWITRESSMDVHNGDSLSPATQNYIRDHAWGWKDSSIETMFSMSSIRTWVQITST